MIAELSGTVRAVAPDGVIVSVGGVGFSVQCTPTTLAPLRVGAEACLTTALVVREDSLTLYGFANADERSVFEILQTATGVGPRLAQAVLGVLSPEGVRRAIADEDLGALTAVPGIGRKVAQRLVLELSGRIGPPLDGSPAPESVPGGPPSGPQQEVREALVSLGYSPREAESAVAGVTPDLTEDAAGLLRAALAILRRR